MNNMTALDVVEQEIKVVDAPLRERLTRIILVSAGIPRSGELAICKLTGRSPRKRLEPPELDRYKDQANTRTVVAALVASVTFTSGFSIPGGFNGSDLNAGIPILLHKAMYKVFVMCNSIAMYSSIMAIVILLWSHVNDPYTMLLAILLSNVPLFVTLAAMPLAFMAGVYVTISNLTWLSIIFLVLGSIALFITLGLFILLYLPLGCRHPLIRGFTDRIIFVGLLIARREAAGSRTAGRAATSSTAA
ncbi:protein ACCELERATED CELL DEATH 6 isoform X2 [Eucalyptus grandis]|uniref:protein ACCELERATED CELL DEATH 6 isoform X2 n=1 Tax=Eucalyptus grandis TaxID=71139 RepID=UPI00192ED362|nr:protein ACCELERATED CELL DEATH 6 isoform X2 [Eucalyptus grandis]